MPVQVEAMEQADVGEDGDVADVVVGDDEAASRQHCAIVPRGERLYLIDLRSTRGTFVDGARLPPNEPTELSYTHTWSQPRVSFSSKRKFFFTPLFRRARC